MSSERVAIKLLQDWNGRRNGTILPIMPRGQANMLVNQGVARFANDNESKDMRNATLCEPDPEPVKDELEVSAMADKPEPVKKKATRKSTKRKAAKK